MKPINLITLQVRIGRCNLNLKAQGFFGISLQMGKNISSLSKIKRIQNNAINFNTTLKMNIENQLVQQQSKAICRILLHLIRQNRDKKVIGIATVDILKQNNQGFKYHQFGQCADYEADIQVSINYGNSFELGVRSQIGYFYSTQYPGHQANELQQSRGTFVQDSILDNSDYNILKQSKAVSHILPYSVNRQAKKSLRVRPQRSKDTKKLRKSKPQNFSSCAPQQIITHYETQIKTFEDQLKERDDWAMGMKQLIQQLQAQNQLLKQLRVDQLELSNAANLEQGIDLVSKFVHQRFQASRSMIYESPKSSERLKLQTPQNQKIEAEWQNQIKQAAQQKQSETQRSLKPTKSYKGLPEIQNKGQVQNSPQKSQIQKKLVGLQSREQLQNALKILTGEQKRSDFIQQNMKISELEEQLFKLRQQKQELYEMTQQVYSQLKKLKIQKDNLNRQIKEHQQEIDRMDHYIEQIKSQNQKLKDENLRYQKNINTDQLKNLIFENQNLQDKSKQLQRQLKQSLKAIEEFKNQALNARSDLINKQDELNSYKLKFGELGSMTEVLIKNIGMNEIQKKQIDKKQQYEEHMSPMKGTNSTSNSTSNLHSLYSNLLQASICQRKQLHHSLSQIINSKGSRMITSQKNKKQQGLKAIQTKINKLFIQIVKSSRQIKNMKQIQKQKHEISVQIQEMISNIQ